ncbi:MAG: hypothetical protein EPN89_19230 [Methylovulum sp.]|nr:MAG: hypothetical protein EPN89_19230 [Methylovulum sp.]
MLRAPIPLCSLASACVVGTAFYRLGKVKRFVSVALQNSVLGLALLVSAFISTGGDNDGLLLGGVFSGIRSRRVAFLCGGLQSSFGCCVVSFLSILPFSVGLFQLCFWFSVGFVALCIIHVAFVWFRW